jgi:hypothetical protein
MGALALSVVIGLITLVAWMAHSGWRKTAFFEGGVVLTLGAMTLSFFFLLIVRARRR